MKQEVIDNINDQMIYEREYREASDRRKYETIRHDMIVYQWILDNRPIHIKTAVDAGYWLVTLDSRLLGFDSFKCKGRPKAKVCLHPSIAAKFLQFWIPSNDALRSAVFSNVRQPLFPASSLSETEKVIFRIIERLGQLKGIEDVSTDAIRNTLADTILQKQMRYALNQDEELQIIEQAFIRIASKAEKRLEEENIKVTNLNRDIEKSKAEVRRLLEVEEGRKIQTERLKKQVVDESERAIKLTRKLQNQDEEIQAITKRLNESEYKSAHFRWLIMWMLIPGALLLLLGIAGSIALYNSINNALRILIIPLFIIFILLVFLALVAFSHSRVPAARDSKLAQMLASLNSLLWFAIFSVGSSLVGSILFDLLKR
jgi:hypothetical protein